MIRPIQEFTATIGITESDDRPGNHSATFCHHTAIPASGAEIAHRRDHPRYRASWRSQCPVGRAVRSERLEELQGW